MLIVRVSNTNGGMGKKRSLHSATIKALTASGFLCEEVERQIPGTILKRDLFGVLDLLAIHPAQRLVVGLQVTSSDNRSSRLRKIQASPRALSVMRSGIEIWLALWSIDNQLTIERLELGDDARILVSK